MRENERVIVYAALVPPREILDELWSVVEVSSDGGSAQAQPSGRRASRRRKAATDDVAGPPSALDVAPVAHVNLTITKFGNLPLQESNRLVEALTRTALGWSSPRLRLKGYRSLESEDDPSVWVDLEGDLDELHAVAKGVAEVAKRLSLFVDRRLFHPRVRLGSVRPGATEAELETVLARLDTFETNAWWQTGISLLTPVEHGHDHPSFKTVADIPLGPHVLH